MVEMQRIGKNAGKIWHALNERKEFPMTELSRYINESYEDTALAIGWLAREDKISLCRRENELFVSLRIPYEFYFG